MGALGARVVGSLIRIARYEDDEDGSGSGSDDDGSDDGGGIDDGGGGGVGGKGAQGSGRSPATKKRAPPLFVATAAFVPGRIAGPTLGEEEEDEDEDLVLSGRLENEKGARRRRNRAQPAPEIPPREAWSGRIRKLAAAAPLDDGGGGGSVPSCLVTLDRVVDFSAVTLPLREARLLLEPLLPESTLGLRGAALVAAFRAAGAQPGAQPGGGGGGGNGKSILWTRTVEILEGARGERTFPVQLQAQLCGASARLSLVAGFGKLVAALRAREPGALLFERFSESEEEDGKGEPGVLVATRIPTKEEAAAAEAEAGAAAAARAAARAAASAGRPFYAPRVLGLIEAQCGGPGGGGGFSGELDSRSWAAAASASAVIALDRDRRFVEAVLGFGAVATLFGPLLPERARWCLSSRELRDALEKEDEKEEEKGGGGGGGREGARALLERTVGIVDALSRAGEASHPVKLNAYRSGELYARFSLTSNWSAVVDALVVPRVLGARIKIERFDDPRDLRPPLFVASRVG